MTKRTPLEIAVDDFLLAQRLYTEANLSQYARMSDRASAMDDATLTLAKARDRLIVVRNEGTQVHQHEVEVLSFSDGRRRMLRAMERECPTCHAAPGQVCTNNGTHILRRYPGDEMPTSWLSGGRVQDVVLCSDLEEE